MKNKVLVLAMILLAFSACKKDKVYILNSDSVSLKHAETFQLTVDGGSEGESFSYSSSNKYVASIDAVGLISGERVGTTSITVTSTEFTGECIVAVVPVYNTFKEPITTYGLTKSEIKAQEKRALGTETSAAILFLGANSERYVIYLFDSSGKSNVACVVLSSAYTTELANYMIERYVIVSTNPVGGVSIDKTFIITTELQTNLDWWVLYGPVTKSAKMDSSASEISKLIELMKSK